MPKTRGYVSRGPAPHRRQKPSKSVEKPQFEITGQHVVLFVALVFAALWFADQPLDKWNVSKVKNMNYMFADATSFNRPLHAPWYVVEQSESE